LSEWKQHRRDPPVRVLAWTQARRRLRSGANPALWFSSLGISAIVGAALYVSTARAGHTRVRLERWQLARFFLMPFCVSSFAALIKGHGFILVFHPSWRDNVLAASACTLFVVTTTTVRRLHISD